MSSSNQSDPRLLLPDWLRDGDAPLPEAVQREPVEATVVGTGVQEIVEVVDVAPVIEKPILASTPYSDRLSLDTRLDPDQLVSPEDLPTWLGGLERSPEVPAGAVAAETKVKPIANIVAIEEPAPYDGVDAPEKDVIDVQVNGWYAIVGAIGLLILLAAALKLYLS